MRMPGGICYWCVPAELNPQRDKPVDYIAACSKLFGTHININRNDFQSYGNVCLTVWLFGKRFSSAMNITGI